MSNPNVERSVLGDVKIRRALVRRLAASSNLPKVILEELHVHNGNAIADVVTVHNEAHCYEIKGETDKISRIAKQGPLYDLVFAKITLVTTENHFILAQKSAPAHWGLMIAREHKGEVTLSYCRRAQSNPALDKRLALLTLWKSELTEVAEGMLDTNLGRFNRDQLTTLIAAKLNKGQLLRAIGTQLAARKSQDESVNHVGDV